MVLFFEYQLLEMGQSSANAKVRPKNMVEEYGQIFSLVRLGNM